MLHIRTVRKFGKDGTYVYSIAKGNVQNAHRYHPYSAEISKKDEHPRYWVINKIAYLSLQEKAR